MNKKFLALIISGLVATGAAFASTTHNILTVRDSFTDTTSVCPGSFETDTEILLQNWYLQNYAILDEEVESKPSNEVSTEEYIKRLSQMPTSIEMPYNSEVRKYIDMYVNRRRTMVEAMLGMSLYYMPIFEQALEQEGMPLELKYLPIVESALNPVAKSPVGAAGLWQFMIKTGKGLGLEVNSLVDERLDPYKSSLMAARYLKQLYKIYKDWSLAIAAYNCGPGRVNQALRQAGGLGKDYWQVYAFLPKETRGYVPAFIAATYVMTYFKQHNISPALAKKPILVDTVTVNRRIHFNQISKVLDLPIEAIRVLNPQYRQDIIPGNSRPYTLALPSQQIYAFLMSEDSIAACDVTKYGQRLVVEPQMEPVASDAGGEYVWETKKVTKTYTVRKGDNLGAIAGKYRTSVAAIKSANGLKSNNINIGQRLKIRTTERVKVYKPAPMESAEDLAAADSLVLKAAVDGMNDDKKDEPKPAAKKPEAEKKPTSKSESSSGSIKHTVRYGESLYVIAQKYGITVDELKRANGLKSNALNAGQKLTIPKGYKYTPNKESTSSSSPSKHTVRSGESLYVIAQKYGITVNELKSANGLKNNVLRPGQKLTIPKKKKSTTASRSQAKPSRPK